MNYKEKLKSPKWQKKRLEILNRDQFTCQYCGDTETTLQVHHKKYTKEPWDAPNEDLITTCEHCHQFIESNKSLLALNEVRKLKTLKGSILLLGIGNEHENNEMCSSILLIKSNKEIQIDFSFNPEITDFLIDFFSNKY